MKTATLILLSLLCAFTIETQKEKTNPYFLFEKFEEGLVYYKDGRQFNVPLNYDIVNRQFLFLDSRDNNTEKAFAEIDMVTLIKVGERLFLHDKKEIKEVLQIEPSIMVQYRAKIRERGKKAGYGGFSETSAIDNLAGIHSGGIYHKLDTDNPLTLSRVDKIYHVVQDKKKKIFSSEKTFLKIYPKHEKALKQYLKQNKTDFRSVDQVVQLCNYAFSLK